MNQAGLPDHMEGELAERTGVIVGTGIGGIRTLADQILLMGEKGPDRMSPFLIPMAISNLAAGVIAIVFGPQGPNFSVVSACATGGHSIGEAWETIRRGDADVMLAGGTEATGHEALVGGFAAMRALSRPATTSRSAPRVRSTRPRRLRHRRGRRRRGLEALEHALARGAEPLAEIVGYGATADASHITLPAPGGAGAVRAIRRALQKAGLGVDDVEMVNAHATSTPEGDPRELEAIKTLFGERAGRSA
jgi:3-oxoacyl-[acyl-carrier-protein] synthase II